MPQALVEVLTPLDFHSAGDGWALTAIWGEAQQGQGVGPKI